MDGSSHRAVRRLRSSLVRDGSARAAFRSALLGVPPRDRDAWLDHVWDSGELPDDEPTLPAGCVPYLPCPVATVLDALKHADVTCDDVFIDVGAGLGRTAVLAHLLTGAGCVGLEIQPGLVRAARGRAAWLNLHRVRFVEGDAAELIRYMVVGTVFFLYCPFSDARLRRVLDHLEEIARTREIRVCCVSMPALDRAWLTPVPAASVDVAVYRSTLRRSPLP